MVQSVLFEDIFDVRALNENGKKFERVNRVHSRGTTYDVDLVIDVNAELFDVRAGERISLAIASTLSTDGTPDDGSYQVHMGPSLLDQYDYAMHGRVFSIKHIENQNVEVQASFGGLLCRLRGEQAQLEALQSDMMIYVLMRKGGSDMVPMDM